MTSLTCRKCGNRIAENSLYTACLKCGEPIGRAGPADGDAGETPNTSLSQAQPPAAISVPRAEPTPEAKVVAYVRRRTAYIAILLTLLVLGSLLFVATEGMTRDASIALTADGVGVIFIAMARGVGGTSPEALKTLRLAFNAFIVIWFASVLLTFSAGEGLPGLEIVGLGLVVAVIVLMNDIQNKLAPLWSTPRTGSAPITGVTDDGALSTLREVTTLAAKVLGPSGSTAGPSVAPSDPPAQPTETLRQLASLHAEGVLTDAEFEAKKAELLKRI